MFRVSHHGYRIDDADTIGVARQIVHSQPLGEYDVNEIRGESFASWHTGRSRA
jgi:hypothetical protein